MKRPPPPKNPPLDLLLARKWNIPVNDAKIILRWHFWGKQAPEKRIHKATLAKYVMRYLRGKRPPPAENVELETQDPWQRLTERQREVASLRLKGYRNAVIAERLQIQPGTVRSHLQAICRSVGAENVRDSLATLRLLQRDD